MTEWESYMEIEVGSMQISYWSSRKARANQSIIKPKGTELDRTAVLHCWAPFNVSPKFTQWGKSRTVKKKQKTKTQTL